jgi:hypothetical protein
VAGPYRTGKSYLLN